MSHVRKFKDGACVTCGATKVVVNGAWLRQRRLGAGLKLKDMASRLGHGVAYLSDIELDRRNCSPRVRAAYEAL